MATIGKGMLGVLGQAFDVIDKKLVESGLPGIKQESQMTEEEFNDAIKKSNQRPSDIIKTSSKQVSTIEDDEEERPSNIVVSENEEEEQQEEASSELSPGLTAASPYLSITESGMKWDPGYEEAVPSNNGFDPSRLEALSPQNLFAGESSILNPDNWPVIGSTDREKEIRRQQREYKEQNPISEGSIVDGNTSGSALDIYNSYFDSQGGLQDGVDKNDYMRRLIESQSLDDQMLMDSTDSKRSSEILKELNQEFHLGRDDGGNTKDDRKSLVMKGSEYKKYREAGIPGRPIEDIDDDGWYNKLDERDNYNFVPYIEDQDQVNTWNAQNVGIAGSNIFNDFARTRDRFTDPVIKYNGEDISYDRLFDFAEDYFRQSQNALSDPENVVMTSDPDDPRVKEGAIPFKRDSWTVSIDDGEEPDVIDSNESPDISWVPTEDGSDYEIMVTWPDVETAYYFDDEQDLMSNLSFSYGIANEGDDVIAYGNVDPLTYTQFDGKEITMPYQDVWKIANGQGDIDYGPLNIAKPANQVSGLTEGIGDWIPNIVDMGLGSSPLWFSPVAWPMSISNAITATTGLDPYSFDPESGTYSLISDDPTADQYMANVSLSGLVPLTERFAGNLGPGKRGILSGPINKAIERYDVNPLWKYPIESVGGEGFEEALAGSWEEVQSMGTDRAFGNELGIDSTGHTIKDPNTPITDRTMNYLQTIPENFTAGAVLGGTMGALGARNDFKENLGPAAEARARRAEIDLEKELGLPRYRIGKRGNQKFELTPEILEQNRREQ